MATFDDIQKWVTLVGAVGAAVTSSVNLWLKFGEKSDKIKVGFGPLLPPNAPGYGMHVVSECDHVMALKDYGFIDRSGKLLSLPQLWTDEPDGGERVVISQTRSFSQRGDLFEVGYVELRDNQIGAFAITAGRSNYRLGFQDGVSWHRRLWIKLKIWWKPRYQ